MSTPYVQQPPPVELTQQAYTTHTGHGSVGPVIAVLAVITVLGVLAGMIGRLCSGRRIMGHGEYDIESWVERKCSSCIDGRIAPRPPAPEISEDTPPETAEDAPLEIKEEEQLTQASHGHSN